MTKEEVAALWTPSMRQELEERMREYINSDELHSDIESIKATHKGIQDEFPWHIDDLSDEECRQTAIEHFRSNLEYVWNDDHRYGLDLLGYVEQYDDCQTPQEKETLMSQLLEKSQNGELDQEIASMLNDLEPQMPLEM